MRFPKKIIFVLFCSIFLNNYLHALTNNEIFELCRRVQNSKECIRKLKIRRYNLYRGKPIEIPVEPFKR